MLFDVASPASASSSRSRTRTIGGPFYHTPAPDPFQEYRDVPLGVVGERRRARTIANDKEFIVADATRDEPEGGQRLRDVDAVQRRNTGQGVGGDSPIYFSQSTDGGATWSPGIEISGSSPRSARRSAASRTPTPATRTRARIRSSGKDGTVYVAFGNGNTPGVGHQPAPVRQVPGGEGLLEPRELDLSDEDRRRLRHRSRIGPDPVERMSGRPPVPAAERLPHGRLRRGIDLRRQRRHAVLGLGGLPQHPRRTATRTGSCRDRDSRRATTTSSTRTRPTVARLGARPSTSRRRRRSGNERPVDAVERRVTGRQEALRRLLRPSVRQLRDDRLQRHHAGHDREAATSAADDRVPANHDGVDAEPRGGQQPGPGRVPRRLHVGRDRLSAAIR